jgi:hypothetical protein
MLEVSQYLTSNCKYRAIAIKTTWYWCKNRYEDQWNRIEDLDMNSHSYTHLIFDKGTKNIQWRKDSLFNKYCWEKWLSVCRKLKLDPHLSPCTSIISKWIEDFNIRPETLQLVHETAWNTLETISVGKNFLSRTPAAQQLRERMDKWDYMKLNSFCITKELVCKLKRPPTEWEKISASYTLDKCLKTRIYRELKKTKLPQKSMNKEMGN